MTKFPKTFLWGAAISAYQAEGNNRWSDWWHWERQGDKIADHTVSGTASDFWNQYKTYINLAKQAGMNCMRISIEWARVNPEPGTYNDAALKHYAAILDYMREQSIEPIVTLWHFTLPQWLAKQGGWMHRDAVKHFIAYVACVNRELGDKVKWWITLNEPSVYLYESYLLGLWPPEHQFDLVSTTLIRNRLIRAHKLAYAALKTKNNFVGIAANLSWDTGLSRVPIINRILEWLPPRGNDWSFLSAIKNQSDYIGLNFYFRQMIKLSWKPPFLSLSFMSPDHKRASDLGWEIAPRGIYEVTKILFKKFNKPILITENGLADAKDQKRAQFINDHVSWLTRASQEKVSILGYIHWALVDNVEWQLGKKPRFGLIEMDYETLKPRPRLSLWQYKKIIEEHTTS